MALYLYCVTAADVAPPAGLTGVGDEVVSSVRLGDLGVWVSPALVGPLDASLEALEAHNAVIETAMDFAITPVPLRFGQCLPSAEAVHERIGRERERWLELLALFRGAVEFGLRVIDGGREPAASIVASASGVGGREYLESVARRLAEERTAREDADRVAAEVRRIVGDLALRERVDLLRTARGIATIAHLVKRTRIDEYHGRLEELRGAVAALHFLASGPWPPYSFVA